MSMFSSSIAVATAISGTMASFQYHPTTLARPEAVEAETQEEASEPELKLTEKALADRLQAERAAGFAEAESSIRQEFEKKATLDEAKLAKAIALFEQHQKTYFARVEAEVVQLALAIAGKILHREAQVDPMLLAALVHLALGQLKEGSSAAIRVRPEEATRWRDHVASQALNLTVKVVEDTDLEHGDCVLETELGSVNFSLDAQLKEVERGFFDVLAQKPMA